EYDLTQGNEKSRVLYFSANANGEAEVVKVLLTPTSSARQKEFDFYFEEISIKGRSSNGNQVTKYPVKNVKFKEAGRSTLAGRKLWYDGQFGRINADEKGRYLGMFEGDDRLLAVYRNGTYEITDQELTQRFEVNDLLLLERFSPTAVLTAIYFDADKQQYNIKRFKIETQTLKTRFQFIKESKDNFVKLVTSAPAPTLVLTVGIGAQATDQRIKVAEFIDVMGWKAAGNKLVDKKAVGMQWELAKPADQQQGELF
ncbi:MAG: DNA gyrase/topoisomerase IV subunit A, partial [Bacteroidetes bacterium]